MLKVFIYIFGWKEIDKTHEGFVSPFQWRFLNQGSWNVMIHVTNFENDFSVENDSVSYTTLYIGECR